MEKKKEEEKEEEEKEREEEIPVSMKNRQKSVKMSCFAWTETTRIPGFSRTTKVTITECI